MLGENMRRGARTSSLSAQTPVAPRVHDPRVSSPSVYGPRVVGPRFAGPKVDGLSVSGPNVFGPSDHRRGWGSAAGSTPPSRLRSRRPAHGDVVRILDVDRIQVRTPTSHRDFLGSQDQAWTDAPRVHGPRVSGPSVDGPSDHRRGWGSAAGSTPPSIFRSRRPAHGFTILYHYYLHYYSLSSSCTYHYSLSSSCGIVILYYYHDACRKAVHS